MKTFAVGVLGLFALAGCAPVTTPRLFQPGPRLQGELGVGQGLAFTLAPVDASQSPDLYGIDDIGGVRPIAQSDWYDVEPTWSPDGAGILYNRQHGWSADLHLVNVSSLVSTAVTTDGRFKAKHRWSSDGAFIAFQANVLDGEPRPGSMRLFTLQLESGNRHEVPVEDLLDWIWMPEGEALLVVSRNKATVTLELRQSDGTLSQRLGEAEFLRDATQVVLSPDASQVAYALADGRAGSLNDSLYVSKLDGAETRLLGGLWMDGAAVWSPDSTQIAFVALTEESKHALFVAQAKTAETRQLMLLDTGDDSGEIYPTSPAWSSDSARIAISSYLEQGSAIFVLNPDGTNLHQITTAGGLIYDLTWKPTVLATPRSMSRRKAWSGWLDQSRASRQSYLAGCYSWLPSAPHHSTF